MLPAQNSWLMVAKARIERYAEDLRGPRYAPRAVDRSSLEDDSVSVPEGIVSFPQATVHVMRSDREQRDAFIVPGQRPMWASPIQSASSLEIGAVPVFFANEID
jgi:hypothetical protein